MDRAEVAKLLAVVAAAYPNFEADKTKLVLWREMFADMDYPLLSAAVKRHIAASRFAPTVAEIRAHAVQLTDGEGLTGSEAWGELMQAVRAHGYYREADAMNALSPRTAQVAAHLGWREINLSTEVGVIRGQFLRMYEQMRDRDEREIRIPSALRARTGGDLEPISGLRLLKEAE